jgi:hypothetical protein
MDLATLTLFLLACFALNMAPLIGCASNKKRPQIRSNASSDLPGKGTVAIASPSLSLS